MTKLYKLIVSLAGHAAYWGKGSVSWWGAYQPQEPEELYNSTFKDLL